MTYSRPSSIRMISLEECKTQGEFYIFYRRNEYDKQ